MTVPSVSLELHRAIVREHDRSASDILAANAALAERVQALEAALDKAADELAHHGNITFRIMDECGLPGSDQRSVYDRCKHIAAVLKAAQDDAARLRAQLNAEQEVSHSALKQVAAMRELVEAVEWTWNGYGVLWCAWCRGRAETGHWADCQRQAALAQTSEVKA